MALLRTNKGFNVVPALFKAIISQSDNIYNIYGVISTQKKTKFMRLITKNYQYVENYSNF